MYINRDDKGIFLMILAILIVSIIAFAAVIGIVWNIISPGVNQVLNLFSTTVKTGNLDYNFYVPPRDSVEVIPDVSNPIVVPEDSGEVIEEPEIINDKDYNFATPAFDFSPVAGIRNYYEIVREDVRNLDNIFQPKLGESSKIIIDKINLDSPIIEEGEGEKAMNAGFWVYSVLDNKKFPDTGITLTCYRRYFDSTDPRSCYYINYLGINDEIKIISDNWEYIYKITGYNEFDSEVNSIYSSDLDKDTLKIVTSSLDGKMRYVIIAERK